MLRLARFSPKNRRLSLSPSALASTLIPGADLCCARDTKVEVSLGSGLNPNELTAASIAANAISTIAATRILRVREFFIASFRIRKSRGRRGEHKRDPLFVGL